MHDGFFLLFLLISRGSCIKGFPLAIITCVGKSVNFSTKYGVLTGAQQERICDDMQLKDSKTYANLLAAFAGESQARCKYQMYAKKAKKDGYEQISAIFEETSDNEYAHAYQWYKYIQGGQVADTQTNLEDAAKGENYEWTQMYKEFAQVAREEGFNEIATHFELVAQIEAEHEQRYQKLCQNIKDQKVFKKDDSQTVWVCRFCGREHVGPQAPGVCPVCKHPQSYFQVKAANY